MPKTGVIKRALYKVQILMYSYLVFISCLVDYAPFFRFSGNIKLSELFSLGITITNNQF